MPQPPHPGPAPNGNSVEVDTVHGPVSVTPGVLDTAAADLAYKNGQCIALALALHNLTGWDVVAHLSRPGDLRWEAATDGAEADRVTADPDWFDTFVHALVRTPDGDLLDIAGPHETTGYLEAARDAHGTAALVTIDPATLSAAAAAHGGPVPDLAVAAGFAAALRERLRST